MLDKLKSVSRTLRREIKVYRLVIAHKHTPLIAKILLSAVIGYALLPFDIIPDFIPLFGQLDDLILLPILFILAVQFIPKEVIDDCRAKAK